MMKLIRSLFRRKPPTPKWVPYPDHPGWFVAYGRGKGLSILYYPGDDDHGFEVACSLPSDTLFFGPFRLPLR